MATADKLVNLADLKAAYDTTVRHDAAQTLTLAQQRTARGNIGAADAGVTGQIINPLTYWGDDGSVNLSGHTLTRAGGDVYTFNSPSATGDVYFRIGGTLGVTSQSNNAAGWSAEIDLLEGVPYTLTITPISGTITGSTNAYVRVFVEGSGVAAADALAQVNTRGGSVTFIWPDGTKKARFISRNVQGFVASNYTFRMTLTVGTPIDNAITIAGTTPTITGIAGCRYNCSATAVTELAFTPPENGLCAVRFKSGSTATVLTLPNTVKMPDWWTGPEASRTYEINFEDGYGVVTSWA